MANPFGFTARERDAESGLMFYRARYYDPEIGRFISQDPIGFSAGDLNVYRYVTNDALSWIDPSGLTAAVATGGTTLQAARSAVSISLLGVRLGCVFLRIADTIAQAHGENLVDGACGGIIVASNDNSDDDTKSDTIQGSSSGSVTGACGPKPPKWKTWVKRSTLGLFFRAIMATISPETDHSSGPPAPPIQSRPVRDEERKRPGAGTGDDDEDNC